MKNIALSSVKRIVFILASFAFAGSLEASAVRELKTKAPLKLLPIKGELTELPRDGKTTYVIAAWASWCQTCYRTVGGITEYLKNNKHDNVRFITVSTDTSWELAKTYIKKHSKLFLGNKLPVYLDKEGAALSAYEMDGVPATLVIYPDGTSASLTGLVSEKNLGPLLKDVGCASCSH